MPVGSPPGQRGQATVEFVALLPVLVAGLLVAWQIVLVGQAVWSAHAAARAAARAHAVGGDELAAARATLPSRLDAAVEVQAPDSEGRIPVRLQVASVIPGLRLGALTASAGFAPQR